MKNKYLLLIAILLLAVSGFSQSKKSQIIATTDTLWRFLNNTNGNGTSTFGFITGSDTVFLQADGTVLNFISSELLHNGMPLGGVDTSFWSKDLVNGYLFPSTLTDYLKLDTTAIQGVDTAVYSHDVVPFWQIMDSIDNGSDYNLWWWNFDAIPFYVAMKTPQDLNMYNQKVIWVDTATDEKDAMPMWQIIDSINAAGGSSGGASEWTRNAINTNYIYPNNAFTDTVVIGDTIANGALTVNGLISQEWIGSTTNYNLSIGYNAGINSITNAAYNVFMGYEAGMNNRGNYSVGIGYRALTGKYVTITGVHNIAIGFETLQFLTTGSSNNAIGEKSQYKNITGSYNDAIGRSTLYYNETGIQNTAIGYSALVGTPGFIDPDFNVAIGYSSLKGCYGDYNTGIGVETMYRMQSGGSNTAVGFRAAYNIQTGSSNVNLGKEAGFRVIAGSRNINIGQAVGYDNQGDDNIAIGFYTMQNQVNGDANIYIGRQAGNGATNSLYMYNLVIGHNAGYKNDTSSYNILIGYKAGYDLEDGENNIAIGKDVEVGVDISDSLNIGNIIQGDLANMQVNINSILKIVPQSATPTGELGMLYVDSDDNHLYYYNGSSWIQLD